MVKLIIAILVCSVFGCLCGIANRVMFLEKETEKRKFPILGVFVLFFVIFISNLFLSLIDYQYSNFLHWVLDRFIGTAMMLVVCRAFLFSIFIFLIFMAVNAIYGKINLFKNNDGKYYEIAISSALFTLSYFMFNAYMFKPLVRFLIRTYIKY